MDKVKSFKAGCLRNHLKEWEKLTSDPEVLQTISGMPIILLGDLPESQLFQYSLGKEEAHFVEQEIANLCKKGVIVKSSHEFGEVISPIFVIPKSDGGFRFILNLKRLNQKT